MSNRVPVHADAFCMVHPQEVVEENGLCEYCNKELISMLKEHPYFEGEGIGEQ